MVKELHLFGEVFIEVCDDGTSIVKLPTVTRKRDGKTYRKGRRSLKLELRDDGYLACRVFHDGVGKWYLVHRLVAQAFIPNYDNKPTVNHKDGNKQNNSVSNLEWATSKEQFDHASANGLVTLNAFNSGVARISVPFEFGGVVYRSQNEARLKGGVTWKTLFENGRRVELE